jgi:hypothetical protein
VTGVPDVKNEKKFLYSGLQCGLLLEIIKISY